MVFGSLIALGFYLRVVRVRLTLGVIVVGPGMLRCRIRITWLLVLSAGVSVFGAPVALVVLFPQSAKVTRTPFVFVAQAALVVERGGG